MPKLLKISYMVFNEFAQLARKIFNGIQYLFIQQYLYLFIYWVNAVAKKMSFHFFFHQYFCSNCRKPNYWYNDNLYVQEQPGWVHVIFILRYSEIDIFNHIIIHFLFVCNRGHTIQYHGGLQTRKLGQAPILVFLIPRPALSSH